MHDILEKALEEVNEPQIDLEQTEHFNAGINTASLRNTSSTAVESIYNVES
jgi:hypothetical protein